MKKEDANEKRLSIIRTILNLSDEEILENDNFTYWGEPDAVTFSHGGTGHPPGPPPPPDPPGGGQG